MVRSSVGKIVALALVALVVSPALAADNYEIDGGHSYAVFRVLHFGIGENYGRFNAVSGSYAFDAADPAASKLSVEIKTDTVDTGSEKRDQHLRSPDFFNVKQFPVITFESTKVEKKDDGLMHVTGKLSLHGVTKEITVPVRFLGETDDPWGNHRSGFAADFTIKRSDFGMTHMIPGIGDEIDLMIGVEGVRK